MQTSDVLGKLYYARKCEFKPFEKVRLLQQTLHYSSFSGSFAVYISSMVSDPDWEWWKKNTVFLVK